MELVNKIKKILFNPIGFYDSLKSEKGFKTVFTYFVITSFFGIVLSFIVNFIWPEVSVYFLKKILGDFAAGEADQSSGALVTLGFWAVSLLVSFLWAGLLHGWILIFGGKENYEKSYQLYIYAKTPQFILGWIPLFGLFAWIYYVVLLIIGTQRVHGISQKKAILMYVIPFGVIVLLSVIGLIFIMTLFSNNPELFTSIAKQ